MNINIQYGDDMDNFPKNQWENCIFGAECDYRSKESIKLVKEQSLKSYKFVYDPSSYKIYINDIKYDIDDLESYISDNLSLSNTVIDCTSLGVPEILLILDIINKNEVKQLDAIYLEPIDYNQNSTKKRGFELSNDFNGFIAIPGFSHSVTSDSKDKILFFCGYESDRIDRAFEDLDLDGKICQLVFGVPAFNAGWEINTFTNNISLLETRNISKHFYYCGASNPLAAYDIISKVYNGLETEEKLFIAPLGTKPMSLGTCLFMVNTDKEKVALLYDHPIKKDGRSSLLSRWNLYNISL